MNKEQMDLISEKLQEVVTTSDKPLLICIQMDELSFVNANQEFIDEDTKDQQSMVFAMLANLFERFIEEGNMK